ncbi:ROK family transcriptional regulator [Rhizobium sp. VS19-DR104.2]|uniref:ROK family transcriptional regulator n=1 Tax=unclassified Rhizobium TaxID=2613769 RepID=UPI001C5AB9CF|nr:MULTISPECIES: ROK family transcriptional regulator [unclassified Rhizobium]MBZ5762360.1 ROK family transcriptional regulator [Rhizobium sp. VS19-DR96]MBZ5769112.1 ROK family transcriptional regulator [Rhizobium sp. VS19-DR129.2]MBZ5775940.1 ROK family transcriptional regulator [Rhizobium sp. VS19-DRK62.2]MBZ5786296.1 ROK family transcriptional regulator [Rhizobium sp. VS19-DR121]MBZ5804290.1 ROK family transcriptional regulator [Rhizobium sp. VS19-DR181]
MQDITQLFLDREAPSGRIVRAIAAIGSTTAIQLVQSTGLARSTVSTLLSELKDSGIVLDLSTKSNGFGRPSQLLSLNPETGRCAGVLLGLGEIRIVICDLAHSVLSDVWFEMPRDYAPEAAAQQIKANLARECALLGFAIADLLGVGLAISAPLSYDGRVLNGDVLPTWGGVNIAALFSDYLDCPIHAENESHCGALAEMTWGAAIGEKDFVLIKFDLGVGGAIVRDGVVQRGFTGSAAEFGHLVLDPNGTLCRCGNRGCLQTFVGGYHLIRHAEEFTGYPVTIDQFVEHARDGRLGYRRLIADAAEKAGWGIGIAATILNPPLFVIVGKLAAIGEAFLMPMERSFSRHTLPPPDQLIETTRPRFVVGKFLGNDDTVLGAVALVLHQHGRVTGFSARN